MDGCELGACSYAGCSVWETWTWPGDPHGWKRGALDRRLVPYVGYNLQDEAAGVDYVIRVYSQEIVPGHTLCEVRAAIFDECPDDLPTQEWSKEPPSVKNVFAFH